MIRNSVSISVIAAVASGFAVEKSAQRRSIALFSHGSSCNDPWPNQSPFSSESRGRSPFSSSSSEHGAYSASIPFMVTQKMRRELIEDLRYTRREVDAMSAEHAASIIASRISRPSPPANRMNTGEVAAVLPVATAAAPDNVDSAGYTLEEMEEQFGDVTERVLHDDQYGPLYSDPYQTGPTAATPNNFLGSNSFQYEEVGGQVGGFGENMVYDDRYTSSHHYQAEPAASMADNNIDPVRYRPEEIMRDQAGDVRETAMHEDQYARPYDNSIQVDPIGSFGSFERSDGVIIR